MTNLLTNLSLMDGEILLIEKFMIKMSIWNKKISKRFWSSFKKTNFIRYWLIKNHFLLSFSLQFYLIDHLWFFMFAHRVALKFARLYKNARGHKNSKRYFCKKTLSHKGITLNEDNFARRNICRVEFFF